MVLMRQSALERAARELRIAEHLHRSIIVKSGPEPFTATVEFRGAFK